MRQLPRFLVLTVFLLPGLSSGAEDSIMGSWQVSRIDRDYRDKPIVEPQPSMIIFADRHYSMFWTRGESSMRAYRNRWVPTDEEKLKRFGEIVVNFGTYVLEGSELRTYPIAAKTPELIGGVFVYDVSWIDGDLVLTMLNEFSYDDVQNPVFEDYSGQIHLTLTRISD
jgi:hypothetical protein